MTLGWSRRVIRSVRPGRSAQYSRWTVCMCIFLIYHLLHSYSNLPIDVLRYYELQRLIDANEGLRTNDDDSPTCRVPRLDPFDASILKYVSRPNPLVCKRVQYDLTYLDVTAVLRVNETEMMSSGYSDLECSARCFDQNTGVDDDIAKFGEWIRFEREFSMGCHFVEVNCVRQILRVSVYSYHLANISRPAKPLLFDPDDQAIKSKDDRPHPPLNVIVLAIDSMSKSNMLRQMPKTYSYIVQNMSGLVFDGHSKIGDNTWVNMLAMFTGLRSVPASDFAADLSTFEEQYFDDYAQYLWRNFSRRGYYTLYSEDRPDIHTFNYGVRKGFLRRPFDYYDRPYWTSVWSSFVRKRSTGFCYNTMAEHKIQFEYLRRFIREHHREKMFGIMWWSSLSHDFLNTIGLADLDTVGFLHSIRAYLNHTVLFVLSDHGNRYDSIRQSMIGRLEARLPFMSMIVPQWFGDRYPRAMENLRTNAQRRLTTHYDIYGTLVDILENNLDSSSPLASTPAHALSLFRPIPSSRTCFQAQIPEEYCSCFSEIALPHGEPMATKAADVMLQRINRLLSHDQPPCARLELSEIVESYAFLPHRQIIRDPQVNNRMATGGLYISYRLVIRTRPGGALLEGTVRFFVDTGVFAMESDVERNNAYGNTSYCVKDSNSKKYCYCLNP